MRGRVDRAAQRGQIAGRPARGVGVDREHGVDAMLAVVAQHGLDRAWVDRQALDEGRAQRLAAEGLDLLGPAIGEVAGAGIRMVERARQVRDHRLPPPWPFAA